MCTQQRTDLEPAKPFSADRKVFFAAEPPLRARLWPIYSVSLV